MSDILKSILLGAVQGATEFLPVSSSGHLIAAKEIFGFEAPLAFDVALHIATLLAVLIYFAPYLIRLSRSPERWAVAFRVLLGTLPAGAIGIALHSWRENIPSWFVVIGWTLSAIYLLLTADREGRSPHRRISLIRATLIGASQGIAAVLPGFSRSGASIAAGLWLGLERREAFQFSFLLSIPIMLGAGLVDGRKLAGPGRIEVPGGLGALAFAMAAAFIIGFLAIRLLSAVVAGNRFHRFGWYNLTAAGGFAIYLICR